jgi:Family of unknown function (DUF6134)
MIETSCKSPNRAGRRDRPAASAAVAFLAALAVAGGMAAAAEPKQMVYQVSHSVFGDIGTYINTVEPVGTGTLVVTQVNFNVKMLGVKVYHEDAQRTERWQGNRLVSFDGVTDKGNGPTKVKGEARGDSFVITSALGTIDAPATVHPANPWSANFLTTKTMMRPDNGKVEHVRVSDDGQTAVTIGMTSIPARKYQIEGNSSYTVWLDGRGVPVKFVADDDSGKVTFTLARCVRCGTDGLKLGER